MPNGPVFLMDLGLSSMRPTPVIRRLLPNGWQLPLARRPQILAAATFPATACCLPPAAASRAPQDHHRSHRDDCAGCRPPRLHHLPRERDPDRRGLRSSRPNQGSSSPPRVPRLPTNPPPLGLVLLQQLLGSVVWTGHLFFLSTDYY